MTDRVAILAHGKFPDSAKTAVGILRYGDREVVGVLDRDRPADRVREVLPDVQDAPIHPDMDSLLADVGEGGVDQLIVGIAPIGGGFDDSWRPDVRAALAAGCDVVAGLHYFLAEDEEFARLADEHGCELHDVRRPPEDLTVSEGVAGDVDAEVVLTVGTDCSVGKMTASQELVRTARDRGYDAAMVPTGQTGIMIEGWGVAVDRVVSDFTAGAVERMVLDAAEEHDYLVVEGQGAIVHPAYSAVTLGILHGAMPDSLVLCHAAGREAVHGYEEFPLPDPGEYVDLYESVAAPVRETTVAAGALNTSGIDDGEAAREAVAAFGDAIDAPAADPVRFGADEPSGTGDVVEAVFP
ncbi:DUF1611 domain-containing protein [Halobacteriales archaeon QS_8_69_26]|nr:MAG: DUF1611 domain-containing protein [Halobacteriales archaeon QS_8_69_26]